ncbi:MAG: hypothetical protein ACLSBA_01095 [Adlercreutzia equolifaciens]
MRGISHRARCELVAEGLRTKEVAKRLAAEFGIPRNDAYNLAMQAAR